jgi:hypothetical protein
MDGWQTGWLADWRTDWIAGRLDDCWEGMQDRGLMDGWKA